MYLNLETESYLPTEKIEVKNVGDSQFRQKFIICSCLYLWVLSSQKSQHKKIRGRCMKIIILSCDVEEALSLTNQWPDHERMNWRAEKATEILGNKKIYSDDWMNKEEYEGENDNNYS